MFSSIIRLLNSSFVFKETTERMGFLPCTRTKLFLNLFLRLLLIVSTVFRYRLTRPGLGDLLISRKFVNVNRYLYKIKVF